MAFTVTVNGKTHNIDADDDIPLLWVIRDFIGLTGAKFGCGISECGACTVMVDGRLKRACTTRASKLGARKVTTIEGMTGREAKAVQAAWVRHDVPQCGYCQSGQIMSAIGLLQGNGKPSDEEIDDAMGGNICRCAAYVRIRAAIKDAAKALEG